jgi:hypothetical protein
MDWSTIKKSQHVFFLVLEKDEAGEENETE